MSNIDYRVPATMRYACSACPMCSCGRLNAAQEALAAAMDAVRVSAASNAVPQTPPPAGFWGKEDRPMNKGGHTCGRDPKSPCLACKDERYVAHALWAARGPTTTDPERTFTRSEVLTVLGCLKTRWTDDGTERGGLRFRAAQQTLDEAIATFERME